MKITKTRLKQIIKEELSSVMHEQPEGPTMVDGEDHSLTQLATLLGVKGVGADVSETYDEPTIPYLMKGIGKAKEMAEEAKKTYAHGGATPREAPPRLVSAIKMYIETVEAVQKNVAAAPKTYAKILAANNLAFDQSLKHIVNVLGEMKEMAETVLKISHEDYRLWLRAAHWMTQTHTTGHGEGVLYFRVGDKGTVKAVNPEVMLKKRLGQHLAGLQRSMVKIAKGAAEQPAAEA